MINYNLILDIFLNSIIPTTKIGVSKGNKIFGAAILKKIDYSIITVSSNNEISNPLFHGEISTLNKFFKENINIKSKDCFFISSHEPCSLCLSAITWSGFDNFYYYFPYDDTKNIFNIPHDLKILKEVFDIKEGKYNKMNKYWKSYSIIDEIKKLSDLKKKSLEEKIIKINTEYNKLSEQYQSSKINNNIPLN